jgi:hypothetical protein
MTDKPKKIMRMISQMANYTQWQVGFFYEDAAPIVTHDKADDSWWRGQQRYPNLRALGLAMDRELELEPASVSERRMKRRANARKARAERAEKAVERWTARREHWARVRALKAAEEAAARQFERRPPPVMYSGDSSGTDWAEGDDAGSILDVVDYWAHDPESNYEAENWYERESRALRFQIRHFHGLNF